MSSAELKHRLTKSRNSGAADRSHGPLLDIAVGQHEPPGHLGQRRYRRLGMLHRLQPVRPVHGGGHPRVDGLERGQQVARVDVPRPERLAPLQVVPDEVLRQRPVRAVPAHHGLPHAAVMSTMPGMTIAPEAPISAVPSGTSRCLPTASIRSPTISTSAAWCAACGLALSRGKPVPHQMRLVPLSAMRTSSPDHATVVPLLPAPRGDRMGRRDASPDFIEALARGLDVIRVFQPRQPAMSLAAVAGAAGLARPPARRVLLTLEHLGYVRAAAGEFELTP